MTTRLLTVAELAERWQRRPEWVRRAANAGVIPGSRIGGLWRFDPQEVERYEARHHNADPLSMTPLSEQRQNRKSA